MDITPVDPSSDLDLRAAYDVERRAQLEGRDGLPHWSWQEMSSMWRHVDEGEDKIMLAGSVDGRMVACGVVFLPMMDNTEKAWLGVDVDPAAQGNGYGRELLAAVEQVAIDRGRTELLAETKLPFEEVTTHRNRRFAEAAGYDFSNVEIVRHLDLPVPGVDLDRWAAQAAVKHAGFRIETHLGRLPEELLESFLTIFGQLVVDAPTGESDWEEEVMTPERFRDQETMLVESGRRMWCTVAVAPDGTVAAYSTISVPPAGGRTDASQWGTFVGREHRGHRLGLATKVANLRAVQEAHPEIRRIVTQNAESNDYMVSINVDMGFEAIEASVEMIKRVGG